MCAQFLHSEVGRQTLLVLLDIIVVNEDDLNTAGHNTILAVDVACEEEEQSDDQGSDGPDE